MDRAARASSTPGRHDLIFVNVMLQGDGDAISFAGSAGRVSTASISCCWHTCMMLCDAGVLLRGVLLLDIDAVLCVAGVLLRDIQSSGGSCASRYRGCSTCCGCPSFRYSLTPASSLHFCGSSGSASSSAMRSSSAASRRCGAPCSSAASVLLRDAADIDMVLCVAGVLLRGAGVLRDMSSFSGDSRSLTPAPSIHFCGSSGSGSISASLRASSFSAATRRCRAARSSA